MAWIFAADQRFYLHEGETLLAGLLRVGIEARHQCGEGYCGTCKIKRHALPVGTRIDYLYEPLVMLEDDEILPCCCQVSGVLHLELAPVSTVLPPSFA